MSRKKKSQEVLEDLLNQKYEIQEPLIKDMESVLTFRHQGKRLYIFKAKYRQHGKGVFVKEVTCEVNQADFDMDKVIQYVGHEKLQTMIEKAFVTSRVVSSRSEVVVSPQAY